MKKNKSRRLPFGGSLPLPERQEEASIHGRRNINPIKYFGDDDPVMRRAYKLGMPKKSKLARANTERNPETAIRTTAKALQNTPFRKWSPELMQDAKKFLDPQIVAAIIKEQQQKKR